MQSETRDMPGKDWLCTASVCTIGNEWYTLLVEKIPIQQAATVTPRTCMVSITNNN